MKNYFKIALIALLAIGITSCGNSTEKSQCSHGHDNNEAHEQTNDTGTGKLWQANPETTQGVGDMKKLMVSFSEKEDVAAYGLLSEKLKTAYGLIFTNCTMKGEAHNQLHNYLMPMGDMFKGIKSTELDVCKNSFEDLNKHLDEYQTIFK
jgi:hypothetical protein